MKATTKPSDNTSKKSDWMLNLDSVTKTFNKAKTAAVSNLSLAITQNTITAIVGESGSGKTTLSRLIAGLETPDSGSISINNVVVSSDTVFVSPEQRQVGMVFQDYALFPHLNVFKNIAYGLSKHSDTTKKVNELLDLVDLHGLEKRYPHQLSGGQQQRVALARALAPAPSVLILDEPFSNLDTNLRAQLRQDVFQIIKQTKVTAIFITHDTDDALAVADHIIVIKNGAVVQHGKTSHIKHAPKNAYVKSLFSRST